MEISKCIYEKNNFLKDEYFNILFDYLKNNCTFHDGEITRDGGAKDKSVRSTKVSDISQNDRRMTMVHWRNFLRKEIMTEVLNYKKLVSEFLEFVQDFDMEIGFLKYEKGDHYTYHVDDGKLTPRTISIIILMNDDYEGGDVCFISPDTKEELKVKKEKNKIIIWPSNFLFGHRITEVTKGTRYSIVSWIR